MEPHALKWRVLLEDAADARHVSTGHLIFLRQGTLMAVLFDLNRLECSGKPVPVVADVMQAMNTWNDWSFSCAGQFSVSDAGCLAYSSGGIFPDSEFSLVWVDHKGVAQVITPAKAPYLAPRLSPDGERIAYTRWQLQSGIWVYDIARSTSSRLAADGKIACALWTSDGARVLFNRAGASVNLFQVPIDASSPMEQLTAGGYQQWPASLSPDGLTLAYVESGGEGGNHDIYALDLQTRRVTPLLNSRFSERFPDFSPDGRWLAYSSNESGRSEVYVRPYPGAAGRWQVSQEGGMENAWSRDGRRLFYRWRGQVWVVDIRTDQGFRAGKPRMLFENEAYFEGTPIRTFDVSPDGQRFLMEKMDEMTSKPVTEMTLVQYWFEELRRLVPAGRD
jgi:serine/threonine-protein kinase